MTDAYGKIRGKRRKSALPRSLTSEVLYPPSRTLSHVWEPVCARVCLCVYVYASKPKS